MMKSDKKFFSSAWRGKHKFQIMVASLILLIAGPFLLYRALQHGNMLFTWLDLALVGMGMLLIILSA